LRVIGYTDNALSTEERNAALDVVAGPAAAGRLTADHEVVPFAAVADAWTPSGRRPPGPGLLTGDDRSRWRPGH
jgi:hypothetical protein